MQFDAARPAPTDPLLLYSLAEFREVIFEAFRVVGARSVAEIGAEGGAFTEQLVGWCEGHQGRLVSIDPAPSDLVRELAARSGATTLREDMSHRVLPDLEPFDAYLIDGDHNYYTVSGELAMIYETCQTAGTHPLLLLQDVGWPAGQRDQYYDPDSIPDDAKQPYDFGGVVPWSDATFEEGFRGDGDFAFARHEGGPANGVRSALEDFLGQHREYETIALPCLFGLTLVFSSTAPWAESLRERLGVYDDNPLLARLESNRILLYLRVIELQDKLARQSRRTAAVEAELGTALAAARTQRDAAGQAARAAIAERDAARAEAERAGPATGAQATPSVRDARARHRPAS